MWSKYGSSRKASRSNSLMPQPVSGVASRSIRERIALASFEAMRLLPVSLRSTRQPANSLTSGSARSRSASSFGMSAGSFWPSPSRVATQAPRAAFTPVRIAVLCPLWRRCRTTRSSGTSALSARRRSSVASRDWSSTYTISKSTRPRRAATISPTSGATLPSSLNTGTTTDNAGPAMSTPSASSPAQALEHAVERLEVGVVDHQAALAAASVQHVDARAQGFRQLALERDDVGLRARLRGLRGLAGGRHLAGRELLHAVLDLAHRPAVLGGLARERDRGLRRQRQQRAGMAHLQRAGLDQGADLGRQLEQAQQVGHRGARTADRGRRLRVGQVELVDQALQRLRFLQRVEVLALDVLDQRHRDHGAVVDLAHHYRDLAQPGQARGAPAALASDDLVVAAAQVADHDRLDHALRADRLGQLGELGVVHGLARLVAARRQRVDRQRAQHVARGRLQHRRLGLGPEQGLQAAAQPALLGCTLAGRAHAAVPAASLILSLSWLGLRAACSRSRWRRSTSPARPR